MPAFVENNVKKKCCIRGLKCLFLALCHAADREPILCQELCEFVDSAVLVDLDIDAHVLAVAFNFVAELQ